MKVHSSRKDRLLLLWLSIKFQLFRKSATEVTRLLYDLYDKEKFLCWDEDDKKPNIEVNGERTGQAERLAVIKILQYRRASCIQGIDIKSNVHGEKESEEQG